MLFSHLHPLVSSDLFPSGFPTFFYAHLISSIRATCPASLTFIIFCEPCTLWTSSCNLFNYLVTFPFLMFIHFPQHSRSVFLFLSSRILCSLLSLRFSVTVLTALSRGSSVSVVINVRAQLSGFDSRQGRGRDFSVLDSFQTGSGVHPAPYPLLTGGYFSWGRAAGT
jgi:hypothetical protein